MGWFNDHQDSYDQFNGERHQAKLSHELLAGAATYEAAKAYENHCAREGRPDDHAVAKEIFAGFAGAAADRLVETKGMDAWDDHKRERVLDQTNRNFDQQYGQGSGYNYSQQGYSSQSDYSQTTSYDQSYNNSSF